MGDKAEEMLLAVMKICEAGNMVVFNADKKALMKLSGEGNIHKNMIYDINTGVKSKIYEKHGMYVYPLYVEVPENELNTISEKEIECRECAPELWDPF